MCKNTIPTTVCSLSVRQGAWSESSVGGPSGVGERHSAMAKCTAGPGQALSPPSSQHRAAQ